MLAVLPLAYRPRKRKLIKSANNSTIDRATISKKNDLGTEAAKRRIHLNAFIHSRWIEFSANDGSQSESNYCSLV
jgi:hypothetical protein